MTDITQKEDVKMHLKELRQKLKMIRSHWRINITSSRWCKKINNKMDQLLKLIELK